MRGDAHSRQRWTLCGKIAKELSDLSASRHAAMRALAHMERRFRRDDTLKRMYAEFMCQYKELGHMSLADRFDQNSRRMCYLPHHGMMRESSVSTKLRVVSSRFGNASGIDVLATDVEKIYRQILIHSSDRDLQRIIWRSHAKGVIHDYKLNTVMYGLVCAPFLVIRTLLQLAADETENYPLGAAVLKRDVYVDNILTSADTMEEANQLQTQLILICKAGGFPLKKWTSNHAELLNKIPQGDRMPLSS